MELPSVILVSVFCFIVGTLAILANVIMIYVFSRQRNFLRPMHSYLLSDGVSNILTGMVLIFIPILLMTHSMDSCMTHWLLEEMLILIIVTGFLSILFIAIERYRTLVLICAPVTHTRRLLIIIFVWFIALVVLSIRATNVKTSPLYYDKNETEICHDVNDNNNSNYRFFSSVCYTQHEFDTVFTTVFILGFYLLPAITSVYFYAKIIKRLWKGRRMGSINHQEKKRKAIKAMVYMLSACAMCWFPFCLYRLTDAWTAPDELCYSYSNTLIKLYVFGCTESAVSVLIYISHSQDFKQALKLVFKCCSAQKSQVVSPYQPYFVQIRPAPES